MFFVYLLILILLVINVNMAFAGMLQPSKCHVTGIVDTITLKEEYRDSCLDDDEIPCMINGDSLVIPERYLINLTFQSIETVEQSPHDEVVCQEVSNYWIATVDYDEENPILVGNKISFEVYTYPLRFSDYEIEITKQNIFQKIFNWFKNLFS